MIGFLKGKIDSVDTNKVILDVNGVGYVVFVTSSLCSELLKQKDQHIKLLTFSITKDDGMKLYGFENQETKDTFCELIKITGLSGKIAIAILSTLSVEQISFAILEKDYKVLTQVSGIGKKLANRIVNELTLPNIKISDEFNIRQNNSQIYVHSDALSALTNLGFNKSKSESIIKRISNEQPNIVLQDLIKSCIRSLQDGK